MGFTTSSCSDIAEDVEMTSTEDVDMKCIDVDVRMIVHRVRN